MTSPDETVLIPCEVIIAAKGGCGVATSTVLSFYRPYINSLCANFFVGTRYSKDEATLYDIKRRLETRLEVAVRDFNIP